MLLIPEAGCRTQPCRSRHDYFQGALLAEQGRYVEVRAHIQRTPARDPEFVMALYLLAQLEEGMGNRDVAIAAYRKVLEAPRLDPRGFFREQARESLQRLTYMR